MMILKGLLIIAVIIPIVLGALFLISINNNESPTIASEVSRLNIQLIREEVRKVSFGVTEQIGAERRDIIFIRDDGSVLFSPDIGYGEQERSNLSIDDLKRIRSYILESGLLFIDKEDFIPDDESLPDEFIRYTLILTIDNSNKRFQWIEHGSEFDPSNAPPLLIRLKDIIYCSTNKADVYGITCS